MLSGTAGTSLPESRRPPGRAPWPGGPHPARVTGGSGHCQVCLAGGPAKPGPGGRAPLPASGTRCDRPTGPARRKTRPLMSRPRLTSLGQSPAGPPGLPARLPGQGRCAQHLDAGDAMRLCRFGTTIAPGAAMPGMAVRRQQAIRLPPARRSLPVPGLHQPVCRGGWRRPDRADAQPPPVPLGTRHPCRAARRRRALRRTTRHQQTQRPGETPGRTGPAHPGPNHGPGPLKYCPGVQNSATGLDRGFYAARSYSLIRPPRTGRRLIRSWERSAAGWSGRGGWSWRLRWVVVRCSRPRTGARMDRRCRRPKIGI